MLVRRTKIFVWGDSLEKHTISQPAEPFLSSVEAVRGAEDEAKTIVQKAKERAEKLVMASREKAVEINVKAEDDAVKEKNRIIAAGRASTGKEVAKKLDEAKRKAEKISLSKISDSDARELASQIIL